MDTQSALRRWVGFGMVAAASALAIVGCASDGDDEGDEAESVDEAEGAASTASGGTLDRRCPRNHLCFYEHARFGGAVSTLRTDTGPLAVPSAPQPVPGLTRSASSVVNNSSGIFCLLGPYMLKNPAPYSGSVPARGSLERKWTSPPNMQIASLSAVGANDAITSVVRVKSAQECKYFGRTQCPANALCGYEGPDYTGVKWILHYEGKTPRYDLSYTGASKRISSIVNNTRDFAALLDHGSAGATQGRSPKLALEAWPKRAYPTLPGKADKSIDAIVVGNSAKLFDQYPKQ